MKKIDALEKRWGKVQVGPIFPNVLDENHLVETLENTQTLKGHSGCVNTLRWNKKGDILASGSDDRRVKLWRAGSELLNLETEHEGNVFAVEFLPGSEDRMLVTGAADRVIFLHDLETKTSRKWECGGRIKRICTAEQATSMFWAASERDGKVIQMDTRLGVPEYVVKPGPTNPQGSGVKSVAVSEAKPNLLLVGFEETPVRLYDRRRFDEPVLTFAPLDTTPHTYHSTHVAFNKTGTEIVVNQGAGGSVVVFSLDSDKDPRVMERFHQVLAEPREPVIMSSALPHAEIREQGSSSIRGKLFHRADDFYTDLILRNDPNRAFRSVCHSNRATALLLRRLKGDTYACIRDSVTALEIHRGNSKALFRLIKSFASLEHKTLAMKCIEKYKEWFPGDTSIAKLEEEVELLGPSEDPEMDVIDGQVDYQQRFTGPTNHQTDIKEANFFGSRDQYIVAGSDCGHMYIWNRDTQKLMGLWSADQHILNIIQPHPDAFLLASSGIDDEIRLWSPQLERSADFVSRKVADPFDFIEKKGGDFASGIHVHVIRDLVRGNRQCVQS